MALKKPLVLNGGQIEQLQAGDTLDASCNEVDVVTMTNANAGALAICTPVYVSSAGNVDKGQANASGTVQLLGLVKSISIGAGGSGSIQTDGVLSATTGQWDAVAGTTGGLTAGTTYYLGAASAGAIVSTPPATGFIVRIGLALNATDLDITLQPPIKL